MYKVFFLSKEIIFKQQADLVNSTEKDVIINLADINMIEIAYKDFIKDPQTERLIFVCSKQVENCFKHFSAHFKSVEAAGGLVKNENHELLMIYRNGMWDLPKGKIEKGESPSEAALREVCEETGIGYLEIGMKLKSTFHIYPLKEKMVLKRTHWYEMKSRDKKLLIPQLNEGITRAEWMKKEEVEEVMKNTYDSLKELMEFYLKN